LKDEGRNHDDKTSLHCGRFVGTGGSGALAVGFSISDSQQNAGVARAKERRYSCCNTSQERWIPGILQW
jgi:hypothetical protein